MLRNMQRATGGPIGRPHFEGSASNRRASRRIPRRMLLAAGAAVLVLSTLLIVTVKSAESEIALGDATGFAVLADTTITNGGPATDADILPSSFATVAVSTTLFILLGGVSAAALILLRPTTPFKGRERDR